MKNSESFGNGEHPPGPNDGAAQASKTKPLLKVFVGAKKPTEVNPAQMERADWELIHTSYKQAGKNVVLEIHHLPQWPGDGRYAVLTLAKSLGASCQVRIGTVTYGDPFEAVLAAMPGPVPMEAHQQGFRAAVEAAALFYGEMADAAAKRINDRLAEVGGAKVNHPSLIKQIRNVAGAGTASKQLDAHAAAKGFLSQLSATGDSGENGPMLRYYQADFYVYKGNRWCRQEDKNFEAQVMAFLQTLKIPNVTARFAKDVVAHLTGMANLTCWDEPMPFLAVNEAPLEIEHPHLSVFQNGVIDLDKVIAGATPKLKAVDSSYFNEIVLPYDFDPKSKCPLWLETLTDILPKTGSGDRRQLVLQEFFGYTLLPDCRFQKMLLLYGPGGNGRSTITETWEAMLGEQNVCDVPLESLGDEFRLWPLKGKLANFSGELLYLGKMHEGLVKRVVSGEVIDANRKHKAPAKFRPFAKLIVNTNDMPAIQDTSDGTWDRLNTMPFEVRIRGTPKQDEERVEKLKAELPGIFNWSIVGLKRLLKQRHFTHCDKCTAFRDQHRTESDTVRLFTTECFEKKTGTVTYSMPLFEFYRLYCGITNRKAVAEPEFGRRMKRLGWEKGREEKGERRRPLYKAMCLSETGRLYRARVLEQSDERRPLCTPICCKGNGQYVT